MKRLTDTDGEEFWHVEEWHYTGDYYQRETSYAATSHDEVSEHMGTAANTIRTVEQMNSSFQ
ncbi:hypothetical protein [Salinibaculum rarum]|uniref:hypothetical protein n=1 Tax=Salinibaculum rarum TaxID=3058903 RepID=UPI00265E8894|nr:hypothetical protein [Salinibaculum sp. KK48]